MNAAVCHCRLEYAQASELTTGSAEAEKRQNCQYDNDEADDVDDLVHDFLLGCLSSP